MFIAHLHCRPVLVGSSAGLPVDSSPAELPVLPGCSVELASAVKAVEVWCPVAEAEWSQARLWREELTARQVAMDGVEARTRCARSYGLNRQRSAGQPGGCPLCSPRRSYPVRETSRASLRSVSGSQPAYWRASHYRRVIAKGPRGLGF